MKLSSEPLTIPPVWDIMPPLNKWLLDSDAADVDIVSSEWLDYFTLLLTSDTITTRPAIVKLQYVGPCVGLSTAWNKQWEPFGPIPSTDLPTSATLNMYPQRASMFHDEATVISGNQIAKTLNANMRYQYQAYQSTPANSNSFSHSFVVKAGTYNFNTLSGTQPQCGRIDWYIDNVKVISLQDYYSAGVTYNVIKTVTDIVIATDGYHLLTGTVNGKHASATDYYILLVKYWLNPATDLVRV
ncbi:MAG: hypothetical protein MUP16_07305 [Sedimentisphaerales bacterium]|nr:hypothetical protein [Sedimentisphaerales bacterium]